MGRFGVTSLVLVFVLTGPIRSSDESPGQKQSGNPKHRTESTAGESVAELIEALKHQDDETRADACHALV
jgi:hypothetical protein